MVPTTAPGENDELALARWSLACSRMVEIEEIDTPADANAAKPSPQEDSTDERTRAFLRSLNLGDEERVGQLADAVEELKRLSSQMGKSQPAAVAAPDKVSCVREGWWYESAEASTAEAFALSRLQAVAKGSGDNAAREGDYSAALDHYHSAMEISWRRLPGGGEELGTLHSNCSLCCLKLEREVEALEHAETAVRMRPNWAKAHARRAQALEAAGQVLDAAEAYKTAEGHADGKKEAAEYTACRNKLEGGGDDGRVRLDWKSHDAEEDIGEPLGEPEAFEPSNARVIES